MTQIIFDFFLNNENKNDNRNNNNNIEINKNKYVYIGIYSDNLYILYNIIK